MATPGSTEEDYRPPIGRQLDIINATKRILWERTGYQLVPRPGGLNYAYGNLGLTKKEQEDIWFGNRDAIDDALKQNLINGLSDTGWDIKPR
jgi:hypothetical protein